jgi:hypothetical protein
VKTKALISVFAILLLSISHGYSQDNLGIAGSNYSPANTLLINPSSIVDSKAFVDIHLAGFGVYAHNDLVYIPGRSMVTFARNQSGIEQPGFDLNKRSYYAVADVNVQGLTVTFPVKKMAFGIYTGARSVTNAKGLPNDIAKYLAYGLQYEELMGEEVVANNLQANSLNWAEFGISLGGIVKQEGNKLVTAGLTIKRLIGVVGGSVHLDQWNFSVIDSLNMTTYDIAGEYGFNEPGWNTGRGWSGDIGITIKQTLQDVGNYTPHNKSSGCATCDYKYKISLALLDVGRLKFDPQFYANEFDQGEEYNWEEFSSTDASEISDVDQVISDEFQLSDPQENFRMWLPAALSAQLDYNFGNNIYLNAAFIGGLPWKNSFGVKRGSQIGLTPRYEIKRFEFALPLILHEYRYPHIGAMVRLNSIIIGSDNIGGLLFNGNTYGADFYMSVKYTIFKSWRCVSKKRPASAIGKKGTQPCPDW